MVVMGIQNKEMVIESEIEWIHMALRMGMVIEMEGLMS